MISCRRRRMIKGAQAAGLVLPFTCAVMAKEWSKPFYNSEEWKIIRKQALKRDGFTCPYCGARATEVHHIIELTPENIHDRNISLNLNNLQSLCHECHSAITMEEHGIKSMDCQLGYYFDEDGQLQKYATPPRVTKIKNDRRRQIGRAHV